MCVLCKIMFLHGGLYVRPAKKREELPSLKSIRKHRTCVTPLECDPSLRSCRNRQCL